MMVIFSLPEGDHGVVDRPTDDEGGGRAQRHLRHVRDARGEPDVREGHLTWDWIKGNFADTKNRFKPRFIKKQAENFPILTRVLPVELAQRLCSDQILGPDRL